MRVWLLQLCPTLCDPMDCHPPSSPVQGILQARTLEWPPLRDLPDPGTESVSYVSYTGSQVLYHQCHLENPTYWGQSSFILKGPKNEGQVEPSETGMPAFI